MNVGKRVPGVEPLRRFMPERCRQDTSGQWAEEVNEQLRQEVYNSLQTLEVVSVRKNNGRSE